MLFDLVRNDLNNTPRKPNVDFIIYVMIDHISINNKHIKIINFTLTLLNDQGVTHYFRPFNSRSLDCINCWNERNSRNYYY